MTEAPRLKGRAPATASEETPPPEPAAPARACHDDASNAIDHEMNQSQRAGATVTRLPVQAPALALADCAPVLRELEQGFGILHVACDARGHILSLSAELPQALPPRAPARRGRPLKDVWPCLAAGEESQRTAWGKVLRVRRVELEEGARLLLLSDATREELTAKALEDALREAEEARRARRIFMQQVAHEFRTPISLITGNAELLLDPAYIGTLPEKVTLALETIRESGDILLRNVNDMLELMRAETEQAPLEQDIYNLAAVLQMTLDEIEPVAARRSIIMDCEQALLDRAAGRRVFIDKIMMRKALRLVLRHAIAVSAPGGAITLAAAGGREGKEVIAISFETGIYTAEQVLEAWREEGSLPEISLTGITSNHAVALARRLLLRLGCEMEMQQLDGKQVRLTLAIPTAPEKA